MTQVVTPGSSHPAPMELHKTRNNQKATQPASPSHSPGRRVRPEELLTEMHCPDTQYLSAVQLSSVWPPNRPRTPCEPQDYSRGLCLVGTKTRQLRGSSTASRPPGNASSMCNGARIHTPKRASVFSKSAAMVLEKTLLASARQRAQAGFTPSRSKPVSKQVTSSVPGRRQTLLRRRTSFRTLDLRRDGWPQRSPGTSPTDLATALAAVSASGHAASPLLGQRCSQGRGPHLGGSPLRHQRSLRAPI